MNIACEKDQGQNDSKKVGRTHQVRGLRKKDGKYTRPPPSLLCADHLRITSFSNFSALSPSGVFTFRR